MSQSNTKIGKGTSVSYSEDSGLNYTALLEVFEVSFPDPQYDDVDVTHYGTTGNMRDYVQGWGDGGEITITSNYLPDEYSALLGLRGDALKWKITDPWGSTIVFDGYLKSAVPSAPNADKMTMVSTVRVTSDVTFTAAP